MKPLTISKIARMPSLVRSAIDKKTEAEAIKKWGPEFANAIHSVLEKHPDAYPKTILHVLIMRKMPPEERLGRALMRGGARSKKRKVSRL